MKKMGMVQGIRVGYRVAAAMSLGLAVAAIGCKTDAAAGSAPIIDMNNGPDPAAVNLAPVDLNAKTPVYPAAAGPSGYTPGRAATQPRAQAPARVLDQRAYPQTASQLNHEQTQAQPQYLQSAPPQYAAQEPAQSQGFDPAYDQQYEAQVDAGQQAIYADQAPPPLPEYEQPELTEPNDQWTPGYWNYAPQGYYWVPGAWVAPPYQGALWTPAYWGYESGRYRLHRGFWGLHIGFYGGIPYGHGYSGHGYEGGYWSGGNFYYNNRVNRLNASSVRNVYVRNVTVINSSNRMSYNGPGGWQERPGAAEIAVLSERRTPPMQAQMQAARAAENNRQQFYAENHGRPAVVATARVTTDRTLPQTAQPMSLGTAQMQQNQQRDARQQQAQEQQWRGREGQAGLPNQQQRLTPEVQGQGSAGRDLLRQQANGVSQQEQNRWQQQEQIKLQRQHEQGQQQRAVAQADQQLQRPQQGGLENQQRMQQQQQADQRRLQQQHVDQSNQQTMQQRQHEMEVRDMQRQPSGGQRLQERSGQDRRQWQQGRPATTLPATQPSTPPQRTPTASPTVAPHPTIAAPHPREQRPSGADTPGERTRPPQRR